MNTSIFGPAQMQVWLVVTARVRNPNNMNGRVQSGYDVQKYPQWAGVPLQGLDRHILTSPVLNLHGGKADQLTLVGGGSEHAQLLNVA